MRAENSQRLTQNVRGGGGSQRLGTESLPQPSPALESGPCLGWREGNGA